MIRRRAYRQAYLRNLRMARMLLGTDEAVPPKEEWQRLLEEGTAFDVMAEMIRTTEEAHDGDT